MVEINVYEELKLDLLDQVDITETQVDDVVRFLWSEGFLDYDTLKERYLWEDEDV